jgi:NitT/TauT family transport system ATP-binding protein
MTSIAPQSNAPAPTHTSTISSGDSPDLKNHVAQFNCALGLDRQLVAVTFFFSKNEYEKATEQQIKAPMSYCSMVRTATLGHARKATVDHVKCPGAKRALGLSQPDEDYLSGQRYHSLGLYKDMTCAKDTTAHVRIMTESVYGFSVQPLSVCDSTPHVIIAICDPNQAMRLVQGYIYNFGPVQPMGSMGMQGVCSELTVRPFQSQSINVSLLCSNTRYSCAWSDGELGVSMPFSAFAKVVEGVISTINAAEPDKKKQAIITRADQVGLQFDIQPGAAYYASAAPPIVLSEEERKIAISVSQISKTHALKNSDNVSVLNEINLDVYDQEFVTIVGPSGCGKSTLLNLMAGLLQPDSGEITVHTNPTSNDRPNLGFISQIDTLLPWRTVLGNVEIGLELRGIAKTERTAIAEKFIQQVGLNGFEHSYPFELSGGMKKRAAVIRTLAYNPDIIFMDEPFVGLDLQTRDELEEDILNIWQAHRKTIVMVTHDLTEAITLSDRVILLSARPAVIKAEYIIPLPRPRSVVETKFTEDFIKLHKQIWQDLSDEVRQGSGEQTHAH